jgi:hypothetical protein
MIRCAVVPAISLELVSCISSQRRWWTLRPTTGRTPPHGRLKDPTLDVFAATPQLPFVFALASLQMGGSMHIDDQFSAGFLALFAAYLIHVVFHESLSGVLQF